MNTKLIKIFTLLFICFISLVNFFILIRFKHYTEKALDDYSEVQIDLLNIVNFTFICGLVVIPVIFLYIFLLCRYKNIWPLS